jgi:hypothetical protein
MHIIRQRFALVRRRALTTIKRKRNARRAYKYLIALFCVLTALVIHTMCKSLSLSNRRAWKMNLEECESRSEWIFVYRCLIDGLIVCDFFQINAFSIVKTRFIFTQSAFPACWLCKMKALLWEDKHVMLEKLFKTWLKSYGYCDSSQNKNILSSVSLNKKNALLLLLLSGRDILQFRSKLNLIIEYRLAYIYFPLVNKVANWIWMPRMKIIMKL